MSSPSPVRAFAVDTSDPEDDGIDTSMDVSVRCPHCNIAFEGSREEVEQELFDHLWKVHEDTSIEFMLQNMYVPEDLKAAIYEELGPDYVSWIVDTHGEVVQAERPVPPRTRKGLK